MKRARRKAKQASKDEGRRRRKGRIRQLEAGEKSFYFLFWLDLCPQKLVKLGLV